MANDGPFEWIMRYIISGMKTAFIPLIVLTIRLPVDINLWVLSVS